MLAVRKMDHGPGHLSCENVPEPELKPGMVKLKIAYCGICGTDTHTYHGVESAFFPFHFPVTFGHGVGVVDEVLFVEVMAENIIQHCLVNIIAAPDGV